MPGLLRLARPLNCVMSAVGVAIGGIVAVGSGVWGVFAWPLAFGAIAAALSTAAGNALNDLADRETDRVNHPDRPLVTGAVSVPAARNFTVAAFVAAAAIATLASLACLAMVVVNAGVLYAYERGLKARGGVGNAAVGYLVGSIFLFAGFAVFRSDVTPLLRTGVLALLAFLATMGREITKDIEDMAGDVDRRTLPQRIGAPRAGQLAAATLVAGVLLSVLPWATAILAWEYAAVVLPADGMFIYAAYHSAARPARSQRVTKYAMVVALVAFLAGGLFL
ncbi:MAG TPA: UbiA family prenyltransferase [Thermoplasmata archaeon]|nr:UbiA family prenyltransferase [Thermoplasmata archaeon]